MQVSLLVDFCTSRLQQLQWHVLALVLHMTPAHRYSKSIKLTHPLRSLMLFVSMAGAMPAAHMSIFGPRLSYIFSYSFITDTSLVAGGVPNSTANSAAKTTGNLPEQRYQHQIESVH